mmetsp:Transcript_9553/g.14233  ORF Transcript_9553/g.14233 Transcript_9553/m.14233 type:complete len:380 (+) Transcript_9553:59-1198(+)
MEGLFLVGGLGKAQITAQYLITYSFVRSFPLWELLCFLTGLADLLLLAGFRNDSFDLVVVSLNCISSAIGIHKLRPDLPVDDCAVCGLGVSLLVEAYAKEVVPVHLNCPIQLLLVTLSNLLLGGLAPWTISLLGVVVSGLVHLWLVFRDFEFLNYLLEWDSLELVGVWLVIVVLGVPAIHLVNSRNLMRKIFIRKLFHLQISLIVLLGLRKPTLLSIAFLLALDAFVLVEVLKNQRLFGFLKDFLDEFLDEKDLGSVTVTHIFLLVGSGMPVVVDLVLNRSDFFLSSLGFLSLGVGDSMAAVGGIKFGKHKWWSRDKTVEGTVGALFSMSLVWLAVSGQLQVSQLGVFVCVSLYEAFTKHIDNLFMPLLGVELWLVLGN